LNLAGQLGERLRAGQVDRKHPIEARGAAQRAPVRPAGRDPHGNARTLHGPGLEFSGPVSQQAVEPFVEQTRAGPGVALLAIPVRIEFAGAVPTQTDAEYEPSAAQSVQRHRLARKFVRSPACDRRHQRPEHEALCRNGHGSERHPRVGDRADRLVERDVVPEKEPIPTALLGGRGELRDQPWLGQLPERGQEDAAAGGHDESLDDSWRPTQP
jgi:hypothetical protein